MLAVVTGASGHLGANLVRLLVDRKWQVRALIRNDTRALEELDIEFVYGDVLNKESLRTAFTGADVVFHLPYDHSKAEGEKTVRAAIEQGLDAVIINPGGMLGPNDFKPSHFGSTLLSIARGKLPLLVDAGLNWVDNRDVAEGMIKACENAETGAKYILSGHWSTLKHIAEYVAKITGVNPPRIVLPMWLAKASAPVSMLFDRVRGQRPLLTPISLRELESNPLLSHEKASLELGYQPRPLEQALVDTIGWLRSQGFLD